VINVRLRENALNLLTELPISHGKLCRTVLCLCLLVLYLFRSPGRRRGNEMKLILFLHSVYYQPTTIPPLRLELNSRLAWKTLLLLSSWSEAYQTFLPPASVLLFSWLGFEFSASWLCNVCTRLEIYDDSEMEYALKFRGVFRQTFL